MIDNQAALERLRDLAGLLVAAANDVIEPAPRALCGEPINFRPPDHPVGKPPAIYTCHLTHGHDEDHVVYPVLGGPSSTCVIRWPTAENRYTWFSAGGGAL